MFASAPDRGDSRFACMFVSARGRGGSRLASMFASGSGWAGGLLVCRFAPTRGRGGGGQSQLLQADIDGPPHFAFAPPLWLARSRPRGRTQGLTSGTTRLRRGRGVGGFPLQRLPEPLQFKNQRSTLRPDRVVMGLPDPAWRAAAVMRCTVSPPHGATLSTIGARRAVFISGRPRGLA